MVRFDFLRSLFFDVVAICVAANDAAKVVERMLTATRERKELA
jgi:hypothetical protein